MRGYVECLWTRCMPAQPELHRIAGADPRSLQWLKPEVQAKEREGVQLPRRRSMARKAPEKGPFGPAAFEKVSCAERPQAPGRSPCSGSEVSPGGEPFVAEERSSEGEGS